MIYKLINQSIIIFLILIQLTCLYGQPGTLDLSFNNQGYILTDFGLTNDYAHSTLIQNDGKIVVVGSQHKSLTDYDIALVRYNIDGSLDATFGENGKVITALSETKELCFTLALQDDGKILIAAISDHFTNSKSVLVIRYLEDGNLDQTFGMNGMVVTDVGDYYDTTKDLIVQNDGKIVVVGSTIIPGGSNSFFVIRYQIDGALDNDFAGNGIVITPIGTDTDKAETVIIQNDEKIVVGGISNNGIDNDFAIARYLPNGELDISFGNGGILTTPITDYNGNLGSGDDDAHTLALQSDGKILLSGSIALDSFAIVRYLSDGTLDSSFGNGGILISGVESSIMYGPSMALQDDDKILLAVYKQIGDVAGILLLRYNTNGELDNSFGNNGIAFTSFNILSIRLTDIILQEDGRIVVVGIGVLEDNNDFFTSRFFNDFNTGISLSENENAKFSIFPNPSSGHFTIQWIGESQGELLVYNSVGEKILEQKIGYQESFYLPEKGIYFIRVSDGNYIITNSILIL